MAHAVRHFSGDLYANEGFWSPPTSAANFCEEDYEITRYIAEFINTLTNLSYVYFALRHPRGRGKRFTLAGLDSQSLTLCFLGICSALFHGTLRHTMQLADDLSMLVLAGSMVQFTYTIGQQEQQTVQLVTTLSLASVAATSIHHIWTGDLIVHTVAFITYLTFLWPRALILIHRRGNRSDKEKAMLMSHFKKAGVSVLVAYTIWNVDLMACDQIRELRHAVGLPWAWVLEGHGWWHVLTAVAADQFIQLARKLDESAGEEESKKKQ